MDKKLCQVRYNHHRKSVMDLLNEIIKERHKIKVEYMIKKSRDQKPAPTGYGAHTSRSPVAKPQNVVQDSRKHDIIRPTRNVDMSSENLFQIKVIQERNELYQRKMLMDQERK